RARVRRAAGRLCGGARRPARGGAVVPRIAAVLQHGGGHRAHRASAFGSTGTRGGHRESLSAPGAVVKTTSLLVAIAAVALPLRVSAQSLDECIRLARSHAPAIR